MDGDKPILAASRNCYKFSRVSWALAQISCILPYLLPVAHTGEIGALVQLGFTECVTAVGTRHFVQSFRRHRQQRQLPTAYSLSVFFVCPSVSHSCAPCQTQPRPRR